MRIFYTLLLTVMLGGVSTATFAQSKLNSTKKSTKIDVFTPEEKDDIQLWFIERSDALKLTPKQNDEYAKVILTNLNTIFHLTDTDKGYSISEIKEKLDDIFVKINKESKPIMDTEQYETHLITLERMENAFKGRLNNPSKETNLYEYLKEIE
ncbi:MAG TPA: hypothetical protein VFD80_07890 [Flavobacteriaceae bacterium]|nr:hypothetical protein [Flavobacteriaceae bacterium]